VRALRREVPNDRRIGLQAANGSNSQAWRWLVVTDPKLRNKIAELYRDAYLLPGRATACRRGGRGGQLGRSCL
jgi:nitroreductase